jgi:hypothetical protein
LECFYQSFFVFEKNHLVRKPTTTRTPGILLVKNGEGAPGSQQKTISPNKNPPTDAQLTLARILSKKTKTTKKQQQKHSVGKEIGS